MFDSKNAMWLGSFFSLLLITYCVSTHLDDLNPTIANIPSKDSQKIDKSSQKSSNISNEIQFPKNVHIENLNTNKKNIKDEENSSSTKLVKNKEILHIKAKKVDSINNEKNETLDLNRSQTGKTHKHFKLTEKFIEKKAHKNKPSHPHQKTKVLISKHKQIEKKKAHKKKMSIKKIKRVYLSQDSFKSLLHGKENNYVNMIAFKYGLNKNRFIKIVGANKRDLAKLKTLFLKKSVKNSDIYLKPDVGLDGIYIYLFERR
jgi:hypothetical protein